MDSSTKEAAPARCRSCSAGIAWITTTKGKKMPVDYPEQWFEPPEDSNRPLTVMVQVGDREGDEEYDQFDGPIYRGKQLSSGNTHKLFGYRSHFASCPNANKHRRKS